MENLAQEWDPIYLLIVLLNYFWLSDDPNESASWYCDQHCFKIGSEVVESIWDAVHMLDPTMADRAVEEGIPLTNRHHRHARPGALWHPMSVWHGMCRENMKRGLVNARAIFEEHTRRTGCIHKATTDLNFLEGIVEKLNFCSPRWTEWYTFQSGVTKNIATHIERRTWCKKFAYANVNGKKKKIDTVNRNTCDMTQFPFMGFKECRIEGDLIGSYRKLYHAKIGTIKGGMRYYHTKPPKWLKKDPRIKIR